MLRGRYGPEKGVHSILWPSAQEPSWRGRSPFLLRTTRLPGGLRDAPLPCPQGPTCPHTGPRHTITREPPAVNTHRHRHIEHTQTHRRTHKRTQAHVLTHRHRYTHTDTHASTHTSTHRCMCSHRHTRAHTQAHAHPLLHGAAVCTLLLSRPTPLVCTASCDSFVCSGLMNLRLLHSSSSLMRRLGPSQGLIGRKQGTPHLI